MTQKNISKIYSILEKIEHIEEIIHLNGSVYHTLMDEVTARPAVLMHLIAIAEQFAKLKQNQTNELLIYFTETELKGIIDVRNFIAHDYDGIELSITEWILHNGLPQLKIKWTKIIESH